MLADVFGEQPARAAVGAGRGDPRGRSRGRRAGRRSAARRRGRRGARRRRRRPAAGDRRLAVPLPADRRPSRRTTSRRSAFILIFAVARRARRGPGRRGTPIRRFSPHFFVLGIAFLLLETKSLVSFSLLFGTTWVVNALAFFAILAQRPARHRGQRAAPIRAVPRRSTRACSRPSRSPGSCPPDALLIDPPEAPLRAGAARSRSPRSSSPTSCSPTRSATPRLGRHVVRHRTCSARWSAGCSSTWRW